MTSPGRRQVVGHAKGTIGPVLRKRNSQTTPCRRYLRRHRALRGAVPPVDGAGMDRRGDRSGHPAGGAVERDLGQQRQVPAGQRTQPARGRSGRAVRHGEPGGHSRRRCTLGVCADHGGSCRADGVPLENRIRLVACRSSVPQAACVYSLIRPLRTGFRRICCLSMSVTVARGTSRSSAGTCCAMPWCGRAVL